MKKNKTSLTDNEFHNLESQHLIKYANTIDWKEYNKLNKKYGKELRKLQKRMEKYKKNFQYPNITFPNPNVTLPNIQDFNEGWLPKCCQKCPNNPINNPLGGGVCCCSLPDQELIKW